MIEEQPGDEPADVVPARVLPLTATSEPFDAFFRAEHARLLALAVAVAGASRADDLVQEAMVRAHREWDRISRYDRPGAWARRVLLNLAASAHRRHDAEQRAMDRLGARPQVLAPPPEIDEFWALVRTLPDRQAAALALHYLEDLPVHEIADMLGCATATARVHLHRGRAALGRLLDGAPTPDEEVRP